MTRTIREEIMTSHKRNHQTKELFLKRETYHQATIEEGDEQGVPTSGARLRARIAGE
jgi:hypothetical protein